MPIITPEQRKRIIQNRGLSPDEWEIDDSGSFQPRWPSSIPTNGNTSQLSGLNLGTRVSSAALQPTALQSFGRGAAEGALPAAGGILGGAGGLALATVLAPETAGLSFLLPLAGAILGGTGAGYAQKELVPEDVKQRFFTRPEDVEANPVASYLGNVAPNALAFNPVKSLRDLPALASAIRKTPNVLRNTSTLTAAEHAAAQNALINAGVSGSFQLPGVISGEQPFSFGRLAADVGTGSLLTRPTGLGRKLGFKAPPEGRVFEPAVSVPEDVVPAATGPQQEARQFGIVPEGALINQEGKVKPLQTTKTLRAIFGSEGERFGGKERLAEDYRRPFKSAAESGEVIRQQELEPLDKRVAESQKILEERRQAELEIERQRTESVKLEAEELKAANERRKVDLATGLKKGYGEEVPLEQRLQTRVEEGRLQGEEQRPETNLGKVLNKAKLTKAQQQELEAPLSEGERIQDEYDRGLREAGESTLPPTPKQETNIEELPFSNLPTNKLTPEIKAKFKQSVEAEAARRGFKVVYKPRVVNAEGKEVMGIYNRNTRTIELSDLLAAGDIPSHEASHGLFYDYLRSTSKADQRLALDAMEFADPAGRKFRNPEDFLNLPESEQVSIEEAAIRNMGVEGYRRRRVDLYGNKRQRFTQWWEDVKSHAKVKFGAAGGEDVQRQFSTRLATDAPYGTRGELAPTAAGVRVAAPLTGREAEESSLPTKTDLQQYQDVQAKMHQLMQEGKSGSQEFQDAWKENETIKNRHGGMPPTSPKMAVTREATKSELPEQPGEGAGPIPVKGRNVGEDVQEQLADSSVKAAQETSAIQRQGIRESKVASDALHKKLKDVVVKSGIDSELAEVWEKNYIAGTIPRDMSRKLLQDLDDTFSLAAAYESKLAEDQSKIFQESYDKANKKAEELHAFSRPDVERQAKESALPPEEGFELAASKELRKEEPFGIAVGKDGKLAGNAVLDRLEKMLPAGEAAILREAGVKDFLSFKRHTPTEVQEWLKNNGPKVEVATYGMEGKVSEAKKEYDKMTHEWYDQQPLEMQEYLKKQKATYNAYTTNPGLRPEYKTAEYIQKANDYIQLKTKVENEPANAGGPRATSAYSQVSALPTNEPMPEWTTTKSGKNVQRVDVVIPIPKDEPLPQQYGLRKEQRVPSKSELWQPDNLHENLPNTLGWAMIQYKTGPKGEKIAVIAEAQSRWGQSNRNETAKLKERIAAGDRTRRNLEADRRMLTAEGSHPLHNHPLLRDYNRLILKAAIEQARKEGATHIVVSDAETAMMTEGHDNIRHAGDPMNPRMDVQSGISQEPGMRLNYDTILPKIAEELTGSKGEKVSLGEHKNAYDAESLAQESLENLGPDEARDNLIFKNPDGTPKTDVSGVMYPLKEVSTKLEKEGPFTLHGKRYAKESALPKEEGTPTPEGRSSFAPMFTARIDKIAEVIKTPTAREVTKKLNRAWSEADLLEGRIGNKLVAVSRGYEPEEIARVREFRHETDAGKKPSFTLTANEQTLKKAYDKTYKEVGELINKEGPGIETKSGEFRRIKLKPEGYQENIIASKVIDAWAESKAEAAQYDKAYIDHLTSKGVSKEEATKTLSDYKQAVGNVGRTPETNFGAIRKAEGYGLPWSLVEQNANASVSRYGRRAAADLSYYKNIESDPRMLKALGISDKSGRRFESLPPDQQAKAEDVEFIGNAKEVQAALRSVRGLIAPPNPRLQSAARLVAADIMQSGTGIRNLVQLPTSIAPYYGVNPLTIFKAIIKMNERAGRAFESNATRPSFKDFDAAGDFDGNPDKFIRYADKLVSFMRKWTGRDLSDKIEGLGAYSLGEELATKWFAGAKVGDIEARRMLNRFGTTLDGNVKDRFLPKGEVTQDDVSRVAKQFVNATRGTYGPSGLPSVAIEGNLAPFLSLSRWSIERSNTFYKDVIKPMQEGNYAPFLKTSLAAVISGAAIGKLNEMLSGKKGQDPTINEVLASGSKEDLVAKGIGILQLGSYAGIVGDMMKLGANVAQGKETKFSSPISFPAASLAETMATNTSNMVEAIRNGEDPFEVMALYLKDILKTSQNARYVMARTNQKETERAGKFRDVRVFQELTGRRDPTSYPSPNQYDNLKSKKFKRTGDLGEAVDLLPELLGDAVASGDIEEIRKELKGLKANSYQTFPDFEKNPIEAAAYLQHLSKTQGEDVAMKRLTDFLIQREINKAKSTLLPLI